MSLTVTAPRGRMTEAELRVAGKIAHDLPRLRSLLKETQGSGAISVKTATGTLSVALDEAEIKACLALLIERQSNFLTLMDIELEQPAP